MKSNKYYEEQQDERYWNKSIKESILTYNEARENQNWPKRKETGLEILALMADKIWCGYETDPIILDTDDKYRFRR